MGIAAAACASLVAVFVVPAAFAGPDEASAKPEADFNGDGYADLAVAAPSGTVNGQTRAGYVVVVYGSPKGIVTAGRQMVSRDTSGVPGVTEKGARFGTHVATGDLDGDGYADLVVNTPPRWTGVDQAEGSQTVVWGGPRGLSGGAEVPGGAWGTDVATGDFDGDGHRDLASLGAETDVMDGTVFRGPFTRSGTPSGSRQFTADYDGMRGHRIAAGDVSGDGTDDLVMLAAHTDEADARTTYVLRGGASGLEVGKALTGTPKSGGEHVAVGDVNCDGIGDVVVGHSFDGYDSDLELPSKGGAVVISYGAQGGPPAAAEPTWINQGTAGVPGAAESADGFGTDVTTGDTDGDGCDDIAAGLPGEDIDGTADAGSVTVLKGARGGVSGTGAKGFHQGTRGVPGVLEKGDRFGGATHLVDGNGDGRTELAVGAPRENSDDGSVWVLPAGPGGITATGTITFSGSLGTPLTDSRLGETFNH